jgi:hypothetical protein
MSSHTSTKKGAIKPVVAGYESLVRFAELLKLRTLAASTQAEYLRYLRKLAARVKRDPAEPDKRTGHDLEDVEAKRHAGVHEARVGQRALVHLLAAVEQAAGQLAAQGEVAADRVLVADPQGTPDGRCDRRRQRRAGRWQGTAQRQPLRS